MLSAIPDLSAQEKTNSSALCKRDRNNNKTTVVVVVAISNYSIYMPYTHGRRLHLSLKIGAFLISKLRLFLLFLYVS